MKYYLGIDPGKLGAYAVMDEGGVICEKVGLPLLGSEYDKAAMRAILTGREYTHVGLEEPGIIHGTSKSSVASLQRCVGMIEGLLVGLQIPYSLIQPKEWQKKMWTNVKTQRKISTTGKTMVNDTKATSTLAVLRLWPSENWKITNKGNDSTKYNDGMIDAALIAEYVRQTYK
jgi:hypothetical protein